MEMKWIPLMQWDNEDESWERIPGSEVPQGSSIIMLRSIHNSMDYCISLKKKDGREVVYASSERRYKEIQEMTPFAYLPIPSPIKATKEMFQDVTVKEVMHTDGELDD